MGQPTRKRSQARGEDVIDRGLLGEPDFNTPALIIEAAHAAALAVRPYILKDAGIAAVPSSAYALSPFFRISTAASTDGLGQALDRNATSVSKLKRKT